MSESSPADGDRAGFYPVDGGERYWNGHAFIGAVRQPPPPGQQQSDPGLVLLAVLASAILTPLVAIIMGAIRWKKNRSDAVKMIGFGLVIWVGLVLLYLSLG